MPSVGPELPPHLAKRKRSIEEDDEVEPPNSPPRKLQAAAAPPHRPLPGPTAPPTTNPDELNLDSDDDEEGNYGPSPQPPNPPQARRILGPALPPAPISERPSYPASSPPSSSDSDDDGYAPALPPTPGSSAEASLLARERAANENNPSQSVAPTAVSPAPQRAEWMIVPPTSSDWSSRMDPTKLKARKFASGRSSSKSTTAEGGISAVWTETHEEKRQRLEDEVLGRKDPAGGVTRNQDQASSNSRTKQEARADAETDRRIREYNEKNRGGRSLYAEFNERKKAGGRTDVDGKKDQEEEEDDPSKRSFDKEKDMGLGGRIGHVQRREMLNRAADFGSRFQKGKYL